VPKGFSFALWSEVFDSKKSRRDESSLCLWDEMLISALKEIFHGEEFRFDINFACLPTNRRRQVALCLGESYSEVWGRSAMVTEWRKKAEPFRPRRWGMVP
jgi:hypothetical protein